MLALEGLADLVATLRRVRAAFNPSLDIAGVLMTIATNRRTWASSGRDIPALSGARARHRDSRDIRCSGAPSHGIPQSTT